MSGAASSPQPELVFLNRQRSVALNMEQLRLFAHLALPLCIAESADGLFALRHLDEVVVTFVSDKRIDRIHRDFMGIPGATDVITFQHGEIVISAETAARCGTEFNHGTAAEAALYLVHGMLHLNGFHDASEADRSRMHAVQDRIWRECLAVCSL